MTDRNPPVANDAAPVRQKAEESTGSAVPSARELAFRIEDENMRAASRGLPGQRAALPPGSLPEQTPDAQGDQNMDPVIQPGRGAPGEN